MKTRAEVLDFLESFIVPKSDRASNNNTVPNERFIQKSIDFFSIPIQSFRFIHIAGTNGKGSTAILLSHILSTQGYKVGLYTSPHLLSLHERIQTNNTPITDRELIKITNEFKEILNAGCLGGRISFFQVMTVLALLHFRDMGCEYVILETGLGGRRDATNYITQKKLCIITSIDYDHTDKLGETLEEIAKEKAAIIQKHNTCILGKQARTLYSVFQEYAHKNDARLVQYQKDFSFSHVHIERFGLRFHVHMYDKTLKIRTALLSIHQVLNIGMVLMALETLGISMTENRLNTCLQNFTIQGRFHPVRMRPFIVLDVAHNVHAMKSLVTNLKLRYQRCTERSLIIGLSQGKDYHRITKSITQFFDRIIITQLNFRLKGDISQEMYAYVSQYHTHVVYSTSFAEAYAQVSGLKEDGLVVVTGSFYLVGEALEYLTRA